MSTTDDDAASEGRKLYGLGKYAEAIVAFTKGLEDAGTAYDDLATLHSNRSACYMQLKDFVKAEEDGESCTTLKPSWGKGWSRLGTAKMARAKYLEAAAAFEKAYEVESESADLKRRYREDAQKARAQSERVSQYYASYRGGSTSATAPPEPVWKNKYLAEFHFMTRLAILATFVTYCCAFQPETMSLRYKRTVRCLILSYGLYILRYFGKPKLKTDYFKTVVMDPTAQRGFGAFILVAGASFMPLLVFVYVELASVASEIVQKLDKGPLALRVLGYCESLKLVDPNSKRVDATVFLYTAYLEVAAGLLLIWELLSPRRNPIFLMMYWQYLQLK